MRIAAVAPSVRETNYFLIRLLFGASLADFRWSPNKVRLASLIPQSFRRSAHVRA